MERPIDINAGRAAALSELTNEAVVGKKPYIAPQIEILDIEATRNSPGGWPDSGIDYS